MNMDFQHRKVSSQKWRFFARHWQRKNMRFAHVQWHCLPLPVYRGILWGLFKFSLSGGALGRIKGISGSYWGKIKHNGYSQWSIRKKLIKLYPYTLNDIFYLYETEHNPVHHNIVLTQLHIHVNVRDNEYMYFHKNTCTCNAWVRIPIHNHT